jgi:hypothetical protein
MLPYTVDCLKSGRTKPHSDGFLRDGRAVVQRNFIPEEEKSSKRRVCVDPGNVRFQDCQL